MPTTCALRCWSDRTGRSPPSRPWLNRLLTKRAIAAERDGRRFLDRPVLGRSDDMHAQTKSLVDRLYGGRIAPLVAEFSARRKLSKKDIAEIRSLVEGIERGG